MAPRPMNPTLLYSGDVILLWYRPQRQDKRKTKSEYECQEYSQYVTDRNNLQASHQVFAWEYWKILRVIVCFEVRMRRNGITEEEDMSGIIRHFSSLLTAVRVHEKRVKRDS